MNSYNTNSIYTTRIDCIDLSKSCDCASMLLEYSLVGCGVVCYTDSVSFTQIKLYPAIVVRHLPRLGGYTIW